MTRKICMACLALAIILPAAAFTIVRAGWLILAVILVGAVWLVGDLKNYRWSGDMCFALLAVLDGVAMTTGFLPILLLLALIAGLVAWDLQRFLQRVYAAQYVNAREEMEQAHLRRLLVVIIPGFALAALPMLVRISLPFTAVLFLALAGLMLLSNAGRTLRRRGE